jgi:hypothetical protein
MADLTGNLATDESLLREAVLDTLRDLLSAAPYDFPATNFHSRRRYIRDTAEWERLTSILDPDNTEAAPEEGEPDNRPRTMRLVTVATAASDYNRDSKLWRLQWSVKIGYGFNDERPENRGNSFDELMKVVHASIQQLLESSTLGFDGASDVDVYRARMVGEPRFVASDAQGRPAHVADLEVYANVEVC